ncbi:MAG TPA: hypothetical protein VFQ05_05820 [Candidatus Eisenbacteria bacterium]|nr:hypothetical protein [Candidatus Eisenbacteria bacterium]
MRSSLIARMAVLLIFALSVHGCGGDNSTNPNNSSLNQGTADDFAIQTVTSMGVVGAEMQVAVGSTPSSAARVTPTPGGIARPARALWDTSFVQGGVTFEASRTFYDENDDPLVDYGPTATWLRWTSRAYGTYEGPRDTATVAHSSSIDVHGIQAGQDTLKFDGGCADTLENRFRSYDGTRTRYFHWTSGTTIDNVRFLKSLIQIGYPAPIGGRVTIVVSADRLRSNNRLDVEAHFQATIVVTFNATGSAVINVDGRYYYYWNLATNQITRAGSGA